MQWEKESHISYLKNKMKMSKSISVIEDYKRTNGASMSGDLKRREKLLVKKFDDTVKDIDDRSDKCFREIQSSGVSADFSDLTKAERLIRDYSIKFYELNNLLLQGNKTLSSIFDCYKEIFKEVNEISAAKLARKKQNEEQKREAEKRQRERDQLRKESYDAFMTEQRRLKAEGAQQAEQRRVAATAERKSKETKKDATEANDQSDLTQSATASQIVESVPSYERTGEKVKTRGVAAPIAASAAGQEVVPPQVAVIPEHIQTFVSEIIDADFETVKDRFEKEIAAEVILRSNNKYVFSFRSPINNEFIKFYADNPHGAQLKKFHTAWRGRMIDALVLAGMKVR